MAFEALGLGDASEEEEEELPVPYVEEELPGPF